MGAGVVESRHKNWPWAFQGEESEEETRRRRERATGEVEGKGDQRCPGKKGQRAFRVGGRCPVATKVDALREG